MADEDQDDSVIKKKRYNYIRALVAYFILGVCNNYGYVVMLSGAHDIVSRMERSYVVQNDRNCSQMSTEAILLADIIPSFIIKLTVPFLPLCVNTRIVICVVLAASGTRLVAFGSVQWIAISGVAVTSVSVGLGELTFLQYSAVFDRNVISTWSSGTGGAGVLGADSCTLFSLISMRVALLCGLAVPGMMAFVFWIILPKPELENHEILNTIDADKDN